MPTRPAVYRIGLAGRLGADRAASSTPPRSTPAALDVPLPLVIVVARAGRWPPSPAMLALLAAGSGRAHPRADLRDVPLVVEDLVKTYARRVPRCGRGVLPGRARPGGRAARAQRRRQDHGDADAGRADPARLRCGLRRTASRCTPAPTCSAPSARSSRARVPAAPDRDGRTCSAYWAATGRPLEEAQLDEALEIAGLGAAIDRRVRGYSQGMRQRLGIAQAMLGLPELLLLDEPTNGLDPPQIKAMRAVLRRLRRDRPDRGGVQPPAGGGASRPAPTWW